ncbi:MAG: ferredoxin, partial [Nitrososphaera sp.]|nr:ferredoxin [Nitrososphaera sp.]
MSALLKDRVWTMLSETAKRGVYPLHGNKLGLYRIPVELTDKAEIAGIQNDLRSSGFTMATHADRIYVTHKWTEKGEDKVTGENLSVEFNITVEIVTGEVVDLIYQIRQMEYFGDPYWVRNYRQTADRNAKMIIDTIIRNTRIGDKMIAQYQKAEKLTLEQAIKKLEEVAPLAKNPKPRSAIAPPPSAAPKPAPAMAAPSAPAAGGSTTISLSGTGTSYSKVDGPIDVGFKSKRQVTGQFQGINVWGPI